MADRKQSQEQSQEFLGGGPKFNTVGKDTRGEDEPPVAANRGNLARIVTVIVVLALLAGGLIYLNDKTPGKSTAQPGRGGGATLDGKGNPATDPNFK